MLRLNEVKLPLDHSEEELHVAAAERLSVNVEDILRCEVFRRAIDARKRSAIQLTYTLDVEVKEEQEVLTGNEKLKQSGRISVSPDTTYHFVTHANGESIQRPVVIGTGPCGLFAGLLLAQMGFKPIILEQGKIVRERTKDTWGFWRNSVFKPNSNVQFGEGGAGTFSDGKLYSQIKDKRHLSRKVLTEFVKAGAPEEILYVAKPHIGTFRLVKIVENMRATIESLGGEFRFQNKVTNLVVENKRVTGVKLHNDDSIASDHVVLAVGHSARDTFRMLHDQGV